MRERESVVCPQCGGRLALVTDGWVGRAPVPTITGDEYRDNNRNWSLERRDFVACTACEFCMAAPSGRRYR